MMVSPRKSCAALPDPLVVETFFFLDVRPLTRGLSLSFMPLIYPGVVDQYVPSELCTFRV